MIEARINLNDYKVIVTGHANAPRNEDGRDMVCCMVSTLTQTLLLSCCKLKGVRMDYDVQKGNVYLSVEEAGGKQQPLTERYTMFLDGVKMLANKYPECVAIK